MHFYFFCIINFIVVLVTCILFCLHLQCLRFWLSRRGELSYWSRRPTDKGQASGSKEQPVENPGAENTLEKSSEEAQPIWTEDLVDLSLAESPDQPLNTKIKKC